MSDQSKVMPLSKVVADAKLAPEPGMKVDIAPTANDLSLMVKHMSHALEFAQATTKRIEVLRGEVFMATKRAIDAEQSRDIIRAHAQASLERYRAQDKLFDHLQELVKSRQDSEYLIGGEYHRGFTEAVAILIKSREDLQNPQPKKER